jgi:hypothetical protein
MLKREDLLQPPALAREIVELPGLGTVIVRELTQAEFADLVASLATDRGRPYDPQYSLKLLVRCLVDEHGNRLLRDEDVEVLGRWPASVLRVAIEAADRLNNLSERAVRADEKNS